MSMRIKVCGATTPADIDLLAGLGVDLIGLWYGIPGGRADLSLEALRRLAARARAGAGAGEGAGTTGRSQPVLVTFLSDVEALGDGIRSSGVRWVQLHGYQPPSMVRALKAAAPDELAVVKVLHVRGRDCVERTLIRSYERAGVDAFLLDAVAEDGRVGSTGQRLDPGVVVELAERMTRPYLLAGGISAGRCCEYRAALRHPRFLGIDVDTNARGADGKFRSDRIMDIEHSWKPCWNRSLAA